jgi:cellulose synthase/poly-beta-1,6-N-acetylglucosamine synthase-like glycosyltransferase
MDSAYGALAQFAQRSAAAVLFSSNDLHRLVRSIQEPDQTFNGLYRWNWFDASLLIPYFAVMIVLAIYGIHRYTMCYRYFKYSKGYDPSPKGHFDELPRVTIQLPMFNEQFVVERLVEAVCAMEYPRDRIDIQVLDDSTDESQEVAKSIVERYKALGHDIVYLHRTDRTGYKAGALEKGLEVAKGEFVAIFDADFIPPKNWIMSIIHHFAEPDVGMVQTRWGHMNRDYNLLTKIEAILLDAHFVIEHGSRVRTGEFFNFNGTAGMWRLQAIRDGGGWEHDTLTEDTDLSYRVQMAGWRFKYLPEIECPSELPIEMSAFKTQQQRWAKGLIQVSIKVLPKVFSSDLSRKRKLEAIHHLTANIAYPLMVVMTVLVVPVTIVKALQGWYVMLFFDLPIFVASTFSVAVFYALSQRELCKMKCGLYPRDWKISILYLPMLMAIGIGLTVTNSKAVMEAIFGKQSAFVRTPKFAVAKKGDKSKATKYRKRLVLAPWIELALGLFFFCAIIYDLWTGNYFTPPFFLIFMVGFWYTGFMSLLQGRFERWRAGKEKSDEDEEESSPRPFPVGV